MAARILVIEDDDDIRNLIAMNLKDMHLDVTECADGLKGFDLARQSDFDLIVLDIMLPGMDGLDICRQLRSHGKTTPILMLTARDSEADRVIGLELGADDYLTKPFSVRELQARIKAQLRRVAMLSQPATAQQESKRFGELTINEGKREVRLAGKLIDLTSTEFDLLAHLARHPGMVYSRAQLLDQVWGYKHSGYEHTVNSHINRLRTKLEADPANPRFVLTVWGVGYKFNES